MHGEYGFAYTQVVPLSAIGVDLDVDSDNDDEFGSPKRDAHEDRHEDVQSNENRPGKLLFVNDDDSDFDGIPDFADGYDWDGQPNNADSIPPSTAEGERFVPMVLSLPKVLLNPTGATRPLWLRIEYDASDPGNFPNDPRGVNLEGDGSAENPFRRVAEEGVLRLWTKDGPGVRSWKSFNDATTLGSYVHPTNDPDARYTELDLQNLTWANGPDGRSWVTTFWVEAVAPSSSPGDVAVTVKLDPDGPGGVGFLSLDTVRFTVAKMSYLDNTNSPLDVWLEGLNVSNWVTNVDLPTAAQTTLDSTSNDPDTFRLEVRDPRSSANNIALRVEILRAQFNVYQVIETLDYSLAAPNQNVGRSNLLRLVTDEWDDLSSGHGLGMPAFGTTPVDDRDPDKQTLLVKLGDRIRLTYEPFEGYPDTRTIEVGRPATEEYNGINQRRHDIRQVNVRVMVFQKVDGSGALATLEQVDNDVRRANERLAQSAIRLRLQSVYFGPAGDGIPLPTGPTLNYTDGIQSQLIGLSDEEEALHVAAGGAPNILTVSLVPHAGWEGKTFKREDFPSAYHRSIFITPDARSPRAEDFFSNWTDPTNADLAGWIWAHEIMHALTARPHEIGNEAPLTSLFHPVVFFPSKRISPYPEAPDFMAQDTASMRAVAEDIP